MFKTFQGDRWRRGVVMSAVFSTVVSAIALDARGVIIYDLSTPDRNTSAPSSSEGLDAWDLQATWGDFLATPIGPTHFIAAKHVGTQSSSIIFQGLTYQVNTSVYWNDPGSDLRIYSLLSGAFSTYAPLYDASVDDSEIGKTLTVIGRGTQRGGEVKVGNDLKGWRWGTGDHVQSWGQSKVDVFKSYNSVSDTSLLGFMFASDGIHNAALSTGDSSGGVFIYANDQWKLAGINYAVSGPFSLTGDPGDSGFMASIFDAQGLYYWDLDSGWEYASDHMSGASYASRISDRLDWIYSVVPEPGTIVMLISAGAFLSAFVFRARRRKSL